MIQANELRLGNYFFIGGIERYVKVSAVFLSHFKCTDENAIDFNNHQNNIKPVELTEEILLKSGGILHGSEYIIKARALPIKIRFNSGIAYCEFGNVYLGDRIKHLHQLQNLYFALCNEELNVQL